MKTFLDSIMEIDNLAKEKIAQADEYKRQCLESAEEKKQEISNFYSEKCTNRIEIFKQHEQEHYNAKKQQIFDEKDKFLERIQNIYDENNVQWEETILKNILSV